MTLHHGSCYLLTCWFGLLVADNAVVFALSNRRFIVNALLCIGLMIPITVSVYVRFHQNSKPKIAVITNCAVDFWVIAGKGAELAAKDFKADVDFRMPALMTAAEQHRVIEDLVVRGVQGIAISVVDSANQTSVLNRIIPDSVYFITQDGDLGPGSKRKCYLGTDNVQAGWRVGRLVREVIPLGGKIVIFVGKLDVSNARERRQGVIAAIAGISQEKCKGQIAQELASSPYPVILGKYTLLDTKTDNADKEKCYANVVDTLVKHPEVNCLVGLWGYNVPAMIAGVKREKKENQIKLVGFDEEEMTLQGLRDGLLHGTVVQNPYMFGYESVHILDHCIKTKGNLPKDMPKNIELENLPDGPHYFVAPRVIKKANDGGLFDMGVDVFAADLKQKKG